MATPITPGQPDSTGPGQDTASPGADVVSLDDARAARPADTTPGTAPDARADAAPDTAADAAPDTGPDIPGGEVVRVDTPGPAVAGDWRADLAARAAGRRPIIAPWLRSRREAAETLKWVGAHYAHVTGYHATRLPKYGGRLAVRAPRGLARLVAGLAAWTFDLEGRPVRMATVRAADPEAYLKLSRQRDSRVRLRVWVAGTGTAGVLAGVAVAAAGPADARLGVLALAAGVLGAAGAPADRPLIDRAVVAHRVEKLTSDMVIRALGALGIPAVTQAIARSPRTAIEFVAPITRDGPGWRADLNLPPGVTVADVLDKRPRLASALRRPLGCIWPEGDSAVHEGRLVMWVGDRDLSTTMVTFALSKASSHDVFKGIPFGSDPRGRPVIVPLVQHNVLMGSQPGQGKTGAVRALACGAVLDPTVEAWMHELKGTGDLDPLEKLCHRFVSGIQDEAIGYAAESLTLLRKEVMRRAAALKSLPMDLCPDKRVTRQIADRRALGLHPLLAIFDECQNLFAHAEYGQQAGEDAEFVIKLGRALGVILVLSTQRPDKRSLPTGVSANVSIRFCLRVGGQTENDMILGTSAYQNGIRATTFVPERDAGIGYLVGATPAPKVVRAAYLDTPATQRIADRAYALRASAGTLTGHALGAEPENAPSHDLLADIAAVVPAGEAKVWNEVIVDRLAGLRPAVYGPWADLEGGAKTAQLTAALKPYGIRTGQVWGTPADGGKAANRIGITRDDITAAITQRDKRKESAPGS